MNIFKQHNLTTPISNDNTLIVFDYDDTLLCSSFISESKLSLDSTQFSIKHLWPDLDKLSQSIINILTEAQKYGEVVIVTNADDWWIQLSAQKFIPEIIPILNTVKIYSARHMYETIYPEDYYMWKYQTIKTVVESKTGINNIISFGDSLAERDSVINIGKELNCYSKSVKFLDKSSLNQLYKQLESMIDNIKCIAEYKGNLDLQLKEKK